MSRTASVPIVAALALAAALPGCKNDLGLPIGAQLRCDDGRCPEGWTCNATLHQCIRNDAIDSMAPSLAAPATATPRDVPLGATVRVRFDVTEDLLRAPVVRLDAGTARTLALDQAASAGHHWEFTYVVAGDEPQGAPCPLAIDLVDRQGLLANGLSGGSLRFDFSPPTISGPTVSGSPVPPGGTVQVRFTASEPPAAPPDVRLASGEVLAHAPSLSSGLDYVYAYTATGLEAEAPTTVLVSLADPAGNAASPLPAGTVVFDRTPPGLANLVVSPAAARTGTLVQVSFAATEDLGADPVVILSGATAVALEKGAQVGSQYAYGHVAVPADGTEVRTLEIRLVDRAGLARTFAPGAQVAFDFAAPAVSALTTCLDDGSAAPCASARQTYSAAPPFDRMKVSFALSEPVASPAVAVGTATLPVGGGGPAGCATPDAGTTWVCRHQVVDAAAGSAPRLETSSVGVVATDVAGNSGSASGWVTLDFDPPALSGTPYLERCDAYAPARVGPADLWTKPVASYAGPGCPYAAGLAHGPVRVHFSVSEPVALGPDGVALSDGTRLTVDPVESTSTQLVAVLTADAAAEGASTVSAHVVDDSGNARRVPLGTLRADLTAPPRPDTATEGRIVYHRAPHGLDATSGATRYVLVGAASAVAAGASVVVYDGPDPAAAGELGRTVATSTGAFGAAPGAAGAFEIAAANLPELWVAQEDPAGNSSPPAVVWDAVWYATMGGKTRGVTLGNPNVFTEQPRWRESRETTAQREPPDPAAVAIRAAAGLATAGQPDLSYVRKTAGAPFRRGGCRMAWDADRGRALLFGGGWGVYSGAPEYDDGTWLWDGGSWEPQVLDVRPPGRIGHGLVHDLARGRTVLFGGCQGDYDCSTLLGDTWEHDGSAWRRVCWPGCAAPACTCTTTPAPRSHPAMFFDHVNGRTVLFGGETAGGVQDDTWTWDGADWRRLTPAASPPARSHALFDSSPHRGDALVASGIAADGSSLSDAWVWDGADWTGYAPTVATYWSAQQLWYDHAARRYYVAFAPSPRLHEWTGSSWLDRGSLPIAGDAAAFQEARWGACGAFDRERGVFVRFGGCLDEGAGGCREDIWARGETWAFTGGAFRQLAPGAAPGARYAAGLAWLPAAEAALLTGGKSTSRYSWVDAWSWDGLGWSGGGTAGTGGRHAFALAPVSDTMLVYFGGTGYGSGGGPPGDTFCSTGGGFAMCYGGDRDVYVASDPATATGFTFQAMAYDRPGARAVFLRGDTGGNATWSASWAVDYWPTTAGGPTSGVRWDPLTTTTTPATVEGHQLAYCAGAGGVVLFGGFDGAALLDETWVWTGSDWSRRYPARSPPARRGHLLLCDEDRGKLYLFGGQGASGHLADVWEYDGATWRERAPLAAPRARREAVGAWIPTTGRGVLFSGWDGAEYFGDTWIWDGGRDARPAHVLRAAFDAAGVWDDALVRRVDVSWDAGGTAASGGPGARLHVWDRGMWNATAAANASPTPAALTWSTASAPEWRDYPPAVLADRVRRLFPGDARELTFAAAPVGTNGTSATLASILTGYAEVAVRYRLACRAAGVATRDAARCCSGAATAGRCL